MKLSTGILLATLTAGSAFAQSPNILQNVQDKMNGVQQQKKAASDEALSGTPSSKTPAAKPAAATAAKPGAVTVPKPASAPAAAKPVAAASGKAPVGPASSKPAVAAPKSANAPAVVKPVATVSNKAPATPAPSKPAAANTKAADPKAGVGAPAAVAKKQDVPAKAAPAKKDETPATPVAANTETKNTETKDEAADKKNEERYITAGNRRDPFVSPIVQHMAGAGCSTGKRCLAIDQISLRGIVKSETGMIAVVVNSLDKAYFLRENDPVFNGYVLKISGDSVVFKETVQDKLGHLSTHEVVKKITTPAV